MSKETASLIGRIGKKWQIICEGTFALCQVKKKQITGRFDEIKLIYSQNKINYNL